MNKLAYRITMSLIVLAHVGLIYVYYWLFFPLNIVELKEFRVASEVKRGEFLQYDLAFEKHMDITPTTKWYVVDGFVFWLADNGSRRPVGNQKVTQQVYIPENPALVSGREYHLKVDISYPILGGLRVVNYSWTSENTFVIK